jgi:hypothetical protein
MNIITRFLEHYSYRFPKGYPDLSNDNDRNLIRKIIVEELNVDIEKENKDVLEEAKGKATLFESALVKAWYELNDKEMPFGAVTSNDLEALTPKMIEDAKKILKQVNLTGGDKAYQLSKLPTTSFWKSHGATDKTTKADFIIGDKKISLKVGPSQLMSGAGNEVTATFYAALKNNPEIEQQVIDDIAKSVKDTFVKGTTKKGNVKQAKQAGDDEELNRAIEGMGVLKKKIEDFFENNPKFRTSFAYEAATGEEKFGGSEGTANHVLVISKNYKRGLLHPIDMGYAAKLASQMKLDINMKSGSEKEKDIPTGRYKYFTVLRANLKDLFKDVSDDIEVKDEVDF